MVFSVPAGRRDPLTFVSPVRAATLGASLLALAVSVALSETAEAQFFNFGYSNGSTYGSTDKRKKPKVKRITRAAPQAENGGKPSKAAAKDTEAVVSKPENPLLIAVSLRRQRVSVFDGDRLMLESPISSGKFSTPTPTGVFSILQKNRIHYSNLYDSAPMPNMQRITWSGVALHAGHLPGYPASHGCIRLPHGFSKKLFGLTTMGTRVIVSNETVQPAMVEHPVLFAALPAEEVISHSLVPASETRVADAASTNTAVPSEVGSIVGVSAAMAATELSGADAILAVRNERREALDRVARAVAEADRSKTEAIDRAKEALRVANEAKEAVRAAKILSDERTADLRKARQARDVAEKKLEVFAKAIKRKSTFTDAEIAKATEDEDRLEAAVLDTSDKATLAAEAAAQAEETLKLAMRAADDAEAKRAEAATVVRKADATLSLMRDEEAAAKRRESKRNNPVHVFISRKTQKLYVRQGYEPILEAAVTFEQPDKPLGTHVFTALKVNPRQGDGLAKVDWTVASIPTYTAPKLTSARDRKAREAQAAAAVEAASEARRSQTARAALDRVSIPMDVRLQIEDLMKPGSSLIVSDNGMSNETGKYTDFIVPVR